MNRRRPMPMIKTGLSISLDGLGAGPEQTLDDPVDVGAD